MCVSTNKKIICNVLSKQAIGLNKINSPLVSLCKIYLFKAIKCIMGSAPLKFIEHRAARATVPNELKEKGGGVKKRRGKVKERLYFG